MVPIDGAERRHDPARRGRPEMLQLSDGRGTTQLPAAPAIRIAPDTATLDLRQITRPSWASAIGRDMYGLWTEFELPDTDPPVRQRLRWIPPGRFMMGSPDDEPGRSGKEGPQHPVVLSAGFWLADTACTQAMWQVVIGENPSSFKGDNLPVESVNWDDVQTFLERLNARVPGLAAVLPSEAQWEFACRAGTETPFSTGVMITTDQANFYGSFPHDGGAKGRYLKETLPVRSFQPNPWGLWQMHGNVREWCADQWHASYDGAPEDGSAWIDPDETSEDGRRERVIRGGSWLDYAGGVRSAARSGLHPVNRLGNLGFRLARVQQS